MVLFWICMWLATVSVGDLCTRRIPNAAVMPGVVAVVVSGCAHPSSVAVSSAFAAGPYLLAFLLRQVGGGDVKLATVLGGLIADWRTVLVIVCLAAVFTLLGAVRRRARRPAQGRARGSAHAPALVAATILVIGPTITDGVIVG